MPKGKQLKVTYMKRMSDQEAYDFFNNDQDWNLASVLEASECTHLNEGGFHAKPIYVEGLDGVVYGGIANLERKYGGANNEPALLISFVIGRKQEGVGIHERMKELGYSFSYEDEIKDE